MRLIFQLGPFSKYLIQFKILPLHVIKLYMNRLQEKAEPDNPGSEEETGASVLEPEAWFKVITNYASETCGPFIFKFPFWDYITTHY